jgi:hypothetical protein
VMKEHGVSDVDGVPSPWTQTVTPGSVRIQ